MAEVELKERTIKHRAFRYFDEVPDPVHPDKTILRQRFAQRGATVKLRPEDIRRGEEHGAFGDPNASGNGEAATEAAGGFDAAAANTGQIVEWLESEKPTIPQTIAAAGDDATTAEKILDAEYQVTGRDARAGAVEGLERIIGDPDDSDGDDDDDEDDEE